ncbi:energy transducer TonB [Cesiribacter andamanensis]|uniref:Gram-negative bacterial tonB protein n=1 Tax=Cesiribacter andamanensis AMV16 TaxID=1279009 RepID=M7MW63_9BACT|nr:energy transducer TonB [Cesiribacter andamanensis]EMR00678.1 Gram-negative bacterial tonB protein [Cesiribacter andamanensis AMV16]
MKKTIIQNWTKYFMGVCAVSGLMLFSSCDSDRRDASNDTAYTTEDQRTPVGDARTGTIDTVNTYDRTSNTELEQSDMDMATPRSQTGDSETSGTTPAQNTTQSVQQTNTDRQNQPADRRQQTSSTRQNAQTSQNQQAQQQDDLPQAERQNVTDRSEYDIQKLRLDFEEVNQQIRSTLRQYPGVGMRYTDDLEGADYSYGTYGIQYENLTDETARKQFQDLELRRSELHEQMRGQMDEKTGTYMAADEDAQPANGYNSLYEFIGQELQYPRNLRAEDIQGTLFVEFRVDENGQVSNPRVVESLDPSAIRLQNNELNPAPTQIQREVNQDEFKAIVSEMEEEVKEVILKTSGMWEPAKMNGQAVAEFVQLPIHFQSGPEDAAIED